MSENLLKLPKMGLGVWQMKPPVCKNAVLKAIEFGYRFIDTAQMYQNEQAVGEALAEKTIDRNELIIATKILPTNYSNKNLKAQCGSKLPKTPNRFYRSFISTLALSDL